MVKTLVTGAINPPNEFWSSLANSGVEPTFVRNELEPLNIDVSGFEAVICNGLFLHNDIDLFKALRYIQVTSAGYDRLPMATIKERGISVHNARGIYSVPIAEWVICKILEIYKQSRFFYSNQQNNAWNKNRNIIELQGKTAVIAGFGSIGQAVATRLSAFGVEIVAVDIIPTGNHYKFCTMDDIGAVLPHCDIVILTLPLTDETEHLFNRLLFEKMKQGVMLINVARGKLINETDLITFINKGLFSGVALDVFEEEPLSVDSPLWNYDNVMITPHNSFVSDRTNERLYELVLNNLKSFLQ